MFFTNKVTTPLGEMLFLGDEEFLYLLEFADIKGLEQEIAFFEKAFGKKSAPGSTPLLCTVAAQVQEYFSSSRIEFTIPIKHLGTPFQKKVWQSLQTIKHGETISYSAIAKNIQREKACRAVGTATGKNTLALIVPCHRVVAASGLGGYKGGVERKKWLLKHERSF